LKPILKDPDNRTKANAAKALFALGDIDVTNNLEKMLSSNDIPTRLSAIHTLGQLGLMLRDIDKLPLDGILKRKLESIELPKIQFVQKTFDSLPKYPVIPPQRPQNEILAKSPLFSGTNVSDKESTRKKIAQLASENKTAEAYLLVSQFIKAYPDDLMAHFFAGNTAFKLERYEDSALHFKKVIELDFFNIQAHANLGMALFKSDKLIEATESLKNALKLKPEYTVVRFNLANIYLKLKKYSDAAKSFEEGLRYQPPTSKILNNLAFAYNKCGNFEKSAEIYRRVIATAPNDAGAYYNLAVLLIRLNRKTEAEQILIRAKSTIEKGTIEASNIKDLLERLSQGNKQ